jgi:hypothetical protein
MRFVFDMTTFERKKLSCEFKFTQVLDFSPYLATNANLVQSSESIKSFEDSKESKILYHLYGIIFHSGTAHGGHYTAYLKKISSDLRDESSPWFCFNDSRVEVVEMSKLKNIYGDVSGSAYMLLYVRDDELDKLPKEISVPSYLMDEMRSRNERLVRERIERLAMQNTVELRLYCEHSFEILANRFLVKRSRSGETEVFETFKIDKRLPIGNLWTLIDSSQSLKSWSSGRSSCVSVLKEVEWPRYSLGTVIARDDSLIYTHGIGTGGITSILLWDGSTINGTKYTPLEISEGSKDTVINLNLLSLDNLSFFTEIHDDLFTPETKTVVLSKVFSSNDLWFACEDFLESDCKYCLYDVYMDNVKLVAISDSVDSLLKVGATSELFLEPFAISEGIAEKSLTKMFLRHQDDIQSFSVSIPQCLVSLNHDVESGFDEVHMNLEFLISRRRCVFELKQKCLLLLALQGFVAPEDYTIRLRQVLASNPYQPWALVHDESCQIQNVSWEQSRDFSSKIHIRLENKPLPSIDQVELFVSFKEDLQSALILESSPVLVPLTLTLSQLFESSFDVPLT